jgi:hypothetical protein
MLLFHYRACLCFVRHASVRPRAFMHHDGNVHHTACTTFPARDDHSEGYCNAFTHRHEVYASSRWYNRMLAWHCQVNVLENLIDKQAC